MQSHIQSIFEQNRDFNIWASPKLISLLDISSDCIFKVLKPLYDVSKVGNHYFATYYIHYKEKLGMTKSIYDLYLFYKFDLLGILRIQTNKISIPANTNFTNNKIETIKITKLIIKDCKYLTFIQPIKFHRAQIKIDLNDIVLTKKSHLGEILVVINHNIDFINSKKITRNKLLFKE